MNSSENDKFAQPEIYKDKLERYGITTSVVEYFHYRNYRYTTPQDAINQAERDAGPSRGEGAS